MFMILLAAIIGVVVYGLIIQVLKFRSQKFYKKAFESKFVNIFYGTQTGTAQRFALKLEKALADLHIACKTHSLDDFGFEDNYGEMIGNGTAIFIISTYSDGNAPVNSKWFYKWINETSNDFRIQKCMLKGLQYAVFGLGDSAYTSNYNKVGKNVDKWLHKLGATRIYPFGEGNEHASHSLHGSQEKDFHAWMVVITDVLVALLKKREWSMEKVGDLEKKSRLSIEDLDESDDAPEELPDDLVDVEDVADTVYQQMSNSNKINGVAVKAITKKKNLKEMITPELRKNLSKQGYRLVGSHSGVKLCRWTKSMLRGRGGCYKHTFYGIESHRCMETTPSLACANKCVFCWRHHTNPVGTEWKWKQDPPQLIVEEAIASHYDMIKQFKGVPGVQPKRFSEGFSIQHCALSLVGEPILYPEINELIELVHEKGISSFLVTNAQFPDAIRDLLPVTQLYVSVDAATPESLKKIDRPLFNDYWPRFIQSLKSLSSKGQRTVYRLTIVKSWNNEEIESYAKLVSLGNPDFIEVKGVTYCGNSSSSDGLTLRNVPWHEEVLYFVGLLAELLPGYEIACEHEHSNCVLIANTKFKQSNGNWKTWINYTRFHELFQQYKETGQTFEAHEYSDVTPKWAIYGSEERGFDPCETRWKRKQKVSHGC
uniref:S-adenosyl-L-methionine-dependent tRNA 4-demethylwyosine synthase TYW1 n=1 Tax=Phallusia mammillata TaxID=59560 RepID=A0A6F9DWQ4_9ASCI|nr:S-adenosyl-L-methionine-dependent tRNA 4-demethylwyosine synthase [Phallusia mammillata]